MGKISIKCKRRYEYICELPRGGGGGDFALLELGITAFRNKFMRSSVRNTGPTHEQTKYEIT